MEYYENGKPAIIYTKDGKGNYNGDYITYDINGKGVRRLGWGFDGHWHGFTFNPSLKKIKDWNGYAKIGRELELSKYYYEQGYFAMIFTEGYCKHIGWNRHVTDKGE
jgi:hypothetical protein